MDDLRQKFISINKRIFNHRDGEVRAMQREYGVVYDKSLGVSIVALQTIASDYDASHELAKMLWEFGGREQTLMAAILEEPEKVDKKELEGCLLRVKTPELWEQITRQLLQRLPEVESYLKDWFSSSEEGLHIFGVLTLGYHPDIFSEKLLQLLMNLDVSEQSYLSKCMQRVLLKVGIRNESAYQLMKKHLKVRASYSSLLEEMTYFYE